MEGSLFSMFFIFKDKKEVICKKLKDTYKVEIIGADYESGRDINVIMGFIKKLIPGEKNLYRLWQYKDT